MEVPLEMKGDFGLASISDGLVVVFVVVLLVLSCYSGINNDKLEARFNERLVMETALNEANDSALNTLVEQVSVEEGAKLQKEQAVEAFFKSLSTQLGMTASELMAYVPACCVMDNDGFYVYNAQEIVQGNHFALQYVWSRKHPYSYSDNSLDMAFRMDGYTTVLDKATGRVEQGTREDLANSSLNSIKQFFSNEKQYEEIRSKAIVGELSTQLQIAMNEHNAVAKQFDVAYQFTIPTVKDSEWARVIEDVSFLSFFQGYAFADGTFFNAYSFAGSRLHRSVEYFGQTESGVKIYHRASCSRLVDRSNSFNSKKECAKNGFYPCTHCNP